jgi:hypothetical protein
MIEYIRRYKEALALFTRDERITEIPETKKVEEVVVETQNPVQFPDYLATKINILA